MPCTLALIALLQRVCRSGGQPCFIACETLEQGQALLVEEAGPEAVSLLDGAQGIEMRLLPGSLSPGKVGLVEDESRNKVRIKVIAGQSDQLLKRGPRPALVALRVAEQKLDLQAQRTVIGKGELLLLREREMPAWRSACVASCWRL